MIEKVLLGFEKEMVPVPIFLYHLSVQKGAADISGLVSFRNAKHRRVHEFIVERLGRIHESEPLLANNIAAELMFTPEEVDSILTELETAWVFRNKTGAVKVAIPFSYEETPHKVILDSGERKYSI